MRQFIRAPESDAGVAGMAHLGNRLDFTGAAVWLAAAYRVNAAGMFYAGLLTVFGLLVACRFLFRLGRSARRR